MKKFITVVPFQVQGQLGSYHYEAVGNQKLQMEEKTSFPILTAVNGYAQPGEVFRVIALALDTEDGRRNSAALEQQLSELCRRKGLVETQVEILYVESDERVAAHVGTFQKLINKVEDNDELFACVTYGTKPLSQAMLMAVQYAYRIKDNASISCIVYGLIDRSKSRNSEDWVGRVYDETALIQLDEIVHSLAEHKVANPKAVIDSILAL